MTHEARLASNEGACERTPMATTKEIVELLEQMPNEHREAALDAIVRIANGSAKHATETCEEVGLKTVTRLFERIQERLTNSPSPEDLRSLSEAAANVAGAYTTLRRL